MIGLSGLEVVAGGFSVGPLDLDVREGEYAVLVGPSGAGKTLVLEAVAGVRRLRSGRVMIGGEDVSALPPERRQVGLVFQDGLLFPHLSVEQNVAYGLRRKDGGRSKLRGRPAAGLVRALASEVGISHLLERRPATLSGGERQRIALARALAAKPRVLLLDEPLSAVDMEAREELQDVLRRVTRKEGLTALHVTHDRAEAFALADLCAVLVEGRLRQTGRPQDVLRRPADEPVARFLGARNVLPATRDARDARVAHLEAGTLLHTSDPLPAVAFRLVVRPEDVEIWPTGGAPSTCVNRLPATVVRLVLQGGHVLVGTEAPMALEALVTARHADRLGLKVGFEVDITVAPESVHAIPEA